jgi:hypothetical protein
MEERRNRPIVEQVEKHLAEIVGALQGVDSLARSQPQPDGCKLNERKVVGGKLVAARLHSAAVVQATIAPLDHKLPVTYLADQLIS